MINREAIYSAMFALLSSSASFKRSGRKLPSWNDVSAGDQPAIFVIQKSETPKTVTNQPTVWMFTADVYLYASTNDPATSPSQILNPIIDAVVSALKPVGAENQTLGGLVQYCRMAGAIQTDEGVLGDQAIVIIPIEILVT